jgi:hypothetical protein
MSYPEPIYPKITGKSGRLTYEEAKNMTCFPDLFEMVKATYNNHIQALDQAEIHASVTGNIEALENQGKKEWDYSLITVRREYDAAIGAFSEKCYFELNAQGQTGYQAFNDFLNKSPDLKTFEQHQQHRTDKINQIFEQKDRNVGRDDWSGTDPFGKPGESGFSSGRPPPKPIN